MPIKPKPSRTGALTDTHQMPFGKYKGTIMQDVPAEYLHYLWTTGIDKNSPVGMYIDNNLDALELENPDLMWSTK